MTWAESLVLASESPILPDVAEVYDEPGVIPLPERQDGLHGRVSGVQAAGQGLARVLVALPPRGGEVQAPGEGQAPA